MNPQLFIGCLLDDVRTVARETLCIVESAPPQRPLRQNAPQKKKNVAAIPREPRKEQRWGELRVLRCREIEDNGEAAFEVTIAREEAFSSSFASALLPSAEKPSTEPSSVV